MNLTWPSKMLLYLYNTRSQVTMSLARLRTVLLLALFSGATVESSQAPLITPAPVARGLLPRQVDDPGPTCGYVNADILQAQYCQNGFTCFAEPTFRAAGGCCRLGDGANCQLPTSCVPQASLSQSCNAACSANARITKCTDSASPYCYTNYWPTAGQTLLNVGCTTAQGQFSFIYTTYTLYGQGFSDIVASTQSGSPIPTFTNTDTSAIATETGNASANSNDDDEEVAAGTSSNSNSGAVSNSEITTNDNSGGSSTNVGAIAGGVVGGVAALGLIAALITWIVLRNKRKERKVDTITTSKGGGGGEVGGGGAALENHMNDPKSPVSTAVSPSVSPHVHSRDEPVSNELQAGDSRFEVPGYAEPQELQHHHAQRRFPELP